MDPFVGNKLNQLSVRVTKSISETHLFWQDKPVSDTQRGRSYVPVVQGRPVPNEDMEMLVHYLYLLVEIMQWEFVYSNQVILDEGIQISINIVEYILQLLTWNSLRMFIWVKNMVEYMLQLHGIV